MRRRNAVLGVLVALVIFQDARAADATAPADAPFEAVYEIELNSVAMPEGRVVLTDGSGRLWLAQGDFAQFRLREPDVTGVVVAGRRYLPLQAVDGAHVRVDAQAQRASIELPASAFIASRESLDERSIAPDVQVARGGFLNYELVGSDIDGEREGAGAAEVGWFGRRGVLTSDMTFGDTGASRRFVRLETTWRHDSPATLRSTRLGDSISTPGSWGTAARFGGIQWGTDFALRPDLVTTPLLSVGGSAIVPSSVDILVNGQKVGSEAVQPGPFVIDRVPAITGAGNVQLVVRDALGREQVIAAPFYSSAVLLRGGLSEYSVELGALRRRFAAASYDYGRTVASATWRRGITDWFTLEGHGEFLDGGPRAAGVDVALQAGTFGVATLTAAGGGAAGRSGARFGIGFERSARRVSFAVRTDFFGAGFRQLADADLDDGVVVGPRTRRRTLVQTGLSLGTAGQLTLAYAHDDLRAAANRNVITLSHSVGLGSFGYLTLVASRLRGDSNATSAFLSLTVPLGSDRSAGLVARRERGKGVRQQAAEASLQRNAPAGRGYGYRLNAASDGDLRADWILHRDALALQLEAVRVDDTDARRATLSGGVTWLGGEWHASRRVDDSFALVDLDGLAGVPVYVDNQPVTRTDARGRALLRNLRPYERNRVSVDATELPLDTWIDATATTVTPAYRSGAAIHFPVRREHGVVLRLKLPNGSFVPAGASIGIAGRSFPVAESGTTYLALVEDSLVTTAEWSGGRCEFQVTRPRGADPLPDVGTVTCRPIRAKR